MLVSENCFSWAAVKNSTPSSTQWGRAPPTLPGITTRFPILLSLAPCVSHFIRGFSQLTPPQSCLLLKSRLSFTIHFIYHLFCKNLFSSSCSQYLAPITLGGIPLRLFLELLLFLPVSYQLVLLQC